MTEFAFLGKLYIFLIISELYEHALMVLNKFWLLYNTNQDFYCFSDCLLKLNVMKFVMLAYSLRYSALPNSRWSQDADTKGLGHI